MNILLLWDINLEYIKQNLNNDFSYFTDYDCKEDIDIIVVRWANFSLDKDYLSRYKNLKSIFVLWIWTDNIDLNYCNENNILVSNEPTISTYSVAELTVWMLIMWIRQVFQCWNNMKNWIYSRIPIWNNLTWKKIWILWYWNIWKNTTKLLNWFKEIRNFTISVYDLNNNQYDEFLDENNIVKYNNSNDFLSNIDYLIIHIDWREENMNLINKKSLNNSNIRWIVNTARKWIVNEKEILDFLNKDMLDFYITDVVKWEPNINDISKELLDNNKVFITPHIWANTYQIQKDLLDSLINKIKKWLN